MSSNRWFLVVSIAAGACRGPGIPELPDGGEAAVDPPADAPQEDLQPGEDLRPGEPAASPGTPVGEVWARIFPGSMGDIVTWFRFDEAALEVGQGVDRFDTGVFETSWTTWSDWTIDPQGIVSFDWEVYRPWADGDAVFSEALTYAVVDGALAERLHGDWPQEGPFWTDQAVIAVDEEGTWFSGSWTHREVEPTGYVYHREKQIDLIFDAPLEEGRACTVQLEIGVTLADEEDETSAFERFSWPCRVVREGDGGLLTVRIGDFTGSREDIVRAWAGLVYDRVLDDALRMEMYGGFFPVLLFDPARPDVLGFVPEGWQEPRLVWREAPPDR